MHRRFRSAVSVLAAVAMVFVAGTALPDPGERRPSGPRLAIEVRWLHRTPGPEERALFDRAARAWSCGLRAYPPGDRRSVVGPLTLTQAGYYQRDGRRVPHTRFVEIDDDMRVNEVEGLLILVDDEWWEPVSTGQPHGWQVDPETGAFRVWLGVVRLYAGARGDLGTALHEIGHVLGIGTALRYMALVRELRGRWYFVGPRAVAVHGDPVPLQAGHTAPCPSAMSYRDCAGEAPSKLDWAMLEDVGYRVVRDAARLCLDEASRQEGE